MNQQQINLNDTSDSEVENHFYKLSKKKPIPCSMNEWAIFMTSASNRIIEQNQIGPLLISTIFTGIDHSFGHGEKKLFETTVLGLNNDIQLRWHFSTYNQAIREHRRLTLLIETKGIDAVLEEIE